MQQDGRVRPSPTSAALLKKLHCVSKNDTDVADYNFNAHQPILVIFVRGIAEKISY